MLLALKIEIQMAKKSKAKLIGILTSGGDCQGLNAAIRAVAKTAIKTYGMDVIGILDGFRGLIENRTIRLSDPDLSGILTLGGTILGTSRDKPDKFPVGNNIIDMTDKAIDNYKKMHLDCLVCLGGGGTQKNALKLINKSKDINIVTLPKTIDNDVYGTDYTFGYDTAVQIAVDAMDRLHSTASSHHRVMILEIMGHNTGWLAAASGIAGGADVVLIPEIPYSIDIVTKDLLERNRKGKNFSIIAVAEGAFPIGDSISNSRQKKKNKKIHQCDEESVGARLTRQIEEVTGLQTRLTTLGHTQRGGTPSAFDRILATGLGVEATKCIVQGIFGVMIAVKGKKLKPIPLEDVAGKRKSVPLDHPIIKSLRELQICMGD